MADPTPGTMPWQAWAIVTVLVALIGAFATFYERQAASYMTATEPTSVVEPPPTERAPPAAPLVDYSDRIGLYRGEALNRTTAGRGMTHLQLLRVEAPHGDVRAEVLWDQGLYGRGQLFGGIDEDGVLQLVGQLSAMETGDWETEIECTFSEPDALRCTYRVLPIAGNPNGTQYGEFTAKKVY